MLGTIKRNIIWLLTQHVAAILPTIYGGKTLKSRHRRVPIARRIATIGRFPMLQHEACYILQTYSPVNLMQIARGRRTPPQASMQAQDGISSTDVPNRLAPELNRDVVLRHLNLGVQNPGPSRELTHHLIEAAIRVFPCLALPAFPDNDGTQRETLVWRWRAQSLVQRGPGGNSWLTQVNPKAHQSCAITTLTALYY